MITRDEMMSVADYIRELYDRVHEAEVEVRTLETELEEVRNECGYLEIERQATVDECLTLEAENVCLVERVAELQHAMQIWSNAARDWTEIANER